MDFAEMMARVQRLESDLQSMCNEMQQMIVEDVRNTPFPGTMLGDGTNGQPLCGVIRFSQLKAAGNWQPSYYFPQLQAAAIGHKLASCKSASAICNAVAAMLRDKKVRCSGGSADKLANYPIGNETVYLNDVTLDALRKSELGRYVAATIDNTATDDHEK